MKKIFLVCILILTTIFSGCSKSGVSNSNSMSNDSIVTTTSTSTITSTTASASTVCYQSSSSTIPDTQSKTIPKNPDLLPALTSSTTIESLILEKQTGCTYQIKDNSLAFIYSNGHSAQLPKEILDKIKNQDLKYLDPYVSLNKTALTFVENGKLIVAYSTDEGKSWNYSNPIDKTPGLSPVGVPYHAADYEKFFFCFISKNNGYLLLWHGSVACGMGSASVLAKTTDGGKNWTLSNAAGFYVSGMYFTDTNIGYIATHVAQPYAEIYRTANGGKDWEPADLICTDSFDKKDVESYYTPYFVNKKGYMPICYQNKSLKYFTSDDNGKTWKYDPSLDCPDYFAD